MRRNKSLVPLSHDHFHGLIIAQLIKKGTPPYNDLPAGFIEKIKCTLEFYKYDLQKHYSMEEEILYPFVKGRDIIIDRLFEQIFSEQQQILVLMDSLKFEKGTQIEDKLNILGHSLETTIRKEERQLFPRIELIFSEERLGELSNMILAAKGHGIRSKRQVNV